MTPEETEKIHKLENQLADILGKVAELIRHVDELIVAVFKGDNLDHSLSHRTLVNEIALDAIKISIDGIATDKRDRAKDRFRLMLVLVGCTLTFLFSAVLMVYKG